MRQYLLTAMMLSNAGGAFAASGVVPFVYVEGFNEEQSRFGNQVVSTVFLDFPQGLSVWDCAATMCGSASASLAAGGTLTATASASPTTSGLTPFINAEAEVVYPFEILGHSSAVSDVHVFENSYFSVDSSGSGGGLGSIFIQSSYLQDQQIAGPYSRDLRSVSGVTTTDLATFLPNSIDYDVLEDNIPAFSQQEFSDSLTLSSNTIYYMTIVASSAVNSNYLSNGGGSGYGFVDPSITIDSIQASQFQVYGGLLGPPIPTASSTPEPATWALLVAGFGLVGAAVRRQRIVTA